MSHHAWLSFPLPIVLGLVVIVFLYILVGGAVGTVMATFTSFDSASIDQKSPKINVFIYCSHTYYPESHWTKIYFPLEVQSLGFDSASL